MHLGPQIDQNKIAFADGCVFARTGFVMRISAVRPQPDDRRVVRRHPILCEVVHDDVRNGHFLNRAVAANLIRDEFPGDTECRVGMGGSFKVHLPLLVVPGRFERLNEIARRDDLRSETADQFDGSGIDFGNIRIRVSRRVFHGDACMTVDQSFNSSLQFLPLQVNRSFTSQMIKHTGLNTVNQFVRRALARNAVEAASGSHLIIGQLQHAPSKNGAPSEITQQPGINVQFSKSGLNLLQIKHGNHSVTVGA